VYVEVNNARLWVEDDGDGPAILFLHGGLGDSRLWEPVAARLADAFRCIRYDLRFYGRSEGPPEEWSSLDDAVGVLEALGVERSAVVGLSLGGGLALDLALAHPERVSALVHVAGGVTGMPMSLSPEQEAAYDAVDTPEAEMDVDFQIWAPLGVDDTLRELWHGTLEARGGLPEGAAPRPRPDADLAQLSVPTLVISARHDPPSLQEIARRIPATTFVEIDSDHYLTLREADEVARLIREFLSP
jgi:3-oxoadipate enol-lactonase